MDAVRLTKDQVVLYTSAVNERVSKQFDKALRLLESPASYRGLAKHPHAHVSLRIWQYPSFQSKSCRMRLREIIPSTASRAV